MFHKEILGFQFLVLNSDLLLTNTGITLLLADCVFNALCFENSFVGCVMAET